MKIPISSRGEHLSRWQVLLCLIVVGLLLYNPFAGLWAANDGFCYDHLARNRATVGASELQHFSPVSNSEMHAELDVDVPATGLLQIVCEEYAHIDVPEITPLQTEFFAEHWNKPPTSL